MVGGATSLLAVLTECLTCLLRLQLSNFDFVEEPAVLHGSVSSILYAS